MHFCDSGTCVITLALNKLNAGEKNYFHMLHDRERPYALTVCAVFSVMSVINVSNIPTH